MSEHQGIAELKGFLAAQPAGPIVERSRLEGLLRSCWDAFHGSDETKMRIDKLGRMEDPKWTPPFLQFDIERHGAIMSGSSRAEVYTWTVNIETFMASPGLPRHRQPMDARLNVKPLAESLAAAIITGTEDPRLKVRKDGSVALVIDLIIPATNNQTTASRRNCLREQLDVLLKAHGWRALRPNVYARAVSRAPTEIGG